MYEEIKTEAAVVANLAERSTGFTKVNDRILLHSDHLQTLDLNKYELGRERKKGTFKTNDIGSFCDFVVSEGNNDNIRIFVDPEAMRAKAYINYEQEGYAQGHLDFQAILAARQTFTFEKLSVMHASGRLNQRAFVEFLEDWGHRVVAYTEDSEAIDNKNAVNSVRNMQIHESSTTDSESGNYRQSRSKLEQVEAKSIDAALPAYFEVEDECYSGLPPRKMRLRLSIGNDDGSPTFKLEIISLALIRDEIAKEFAELVENAFDGPLMTLIGNFDGY